MLSTPNTQTGSSYTFVAADTTRVVVFNNAGAVAASLPNGATFGFGPGTMLSVVNAGSGTVTITCTSCTITVNGSASGTLALTSGQAADIYGGYGSSQANYVALPSPSGANAALLNANNTFTGIDNFDANVYFGSGSPWIDVKSNLYGAVGNGGTNDAGPINTAISSTTSASEGVPSTIFLPTSLYQVQSTIIDKQSVVLRGEDKGTVIRADPALFPVSTPVVQVGATALNNNTRVDHLIVNCNSVAGSTGLFTNTAQELSGAEFVTSELCALYGVDVENGSANSMWSNMVVEETSAATAEGFRINTNASAKTTISNVTVIPASGGPDTACIHDVSGFAFVYSLHCENNTDGVRFDSGAYGLVDGYTGQTNVTNAVEIKAGAGAVSLHEIEKNGGTNTVLDADCGVTLSTDNAIPWYEHIGSKCTWLDSTGFHAQALVTTGAVPTPSGTGACSTITTQTGAQAAGTFKCTGTTGASTVTLTFATTMPTGWRCSMDDETTWSAANAWHQTGHTQTTCVMTSTSITANDITIFSAAAF